MVWCGWSESNGRLDRYPNGNRSKTNPIPDDDDTDPAAETPIPHSTAPAVLGGKSGRWNRQAALQAVAQRGRAVMVGPEQRSVARWGAPRQATLAGRLSCDERHANTSQSRVRRCHDGRCAHHFDVHRAHTRVAAHKSPTMETKEQGPKETKATSTKRPTCSTWRASEPRSHGSACRCATQHA